MMHLWATKKGKIIWCVIATSIAVIAFIVTAFLLLEINRGNPAAFLQTGGAAYCDVAYGGDTLQMYSYVDSQPDEIAQRIGRLRWKPAESVERWRYTSEYRLSWIKDGGKVCSFEICKTGNNVMAVARQGEQTRYYSAAATAHEEIQDIYDNAKKKNEALMIFIRRLAKVTLQNLHYDQLQPEDFYLLAIAAQYGTQAESLLQGADKKGLTYFNAELAQKAVQAYFPNQVQKAGFSNENMTVSESSIIISEQVLDRHLFDSVTAQRGVWDASEDPWPAPQYLSDGRIQWALCIDGDFEKVQSEIILSKRGAAMQVEGAPGFYISGLDVTRGDFDAAKLVCDGGVLEEERKVVQAGPLAPSEETTYKSAPADPGWVLAGSASWNHLTVSTYYPARKDLEWQSIRVKVLNRRTGAVISEKQVTAHLNQLEDPPYAIKTAEEDQQHKKAFIAGCACLVIDDDGAVIELYPFSQSPLEQYDFFYLQTKEGTEEPVLYANKFQDGDGKSLWAWEPAAGAFSKISNGDGSVQSDGSILVDQWDPTEKKSSYVRYDSKSAQVVGRCEGTSASSWTGSVNREECAWMNGALIEYWNVNSKQYMLIYDMQTGQYKQYELGLSSKRYFGQWNNTLFLSRLEALSDGSRWTVYRMDLSDPQAKPVTINQLFCRGITDPRFQVDPQQVARISFTHTDYITPWGEEIAFRLS